MAVSCPEVMYGAYYPYLYGRGAARSFHHASHFQYDRLNAQGGAGHAGSGECGPGAGPGAGPAALSCGSGSSGAQSPGSPPAPGPGPGPARARLRTKEEDLSAHSRASADGGGSSESEGECGGGGAMCGGGGGGGGAGRGRAQYVSANCVVFTHYSGDVSAVVDEHFTRALAVDKHKECVPMVSRNLPASFFNAAAAAGLAGVAPGACAGVDIYDYDPWHQHYPGYGHAAHRHAAEYHAAAAATAQAHHSMAAAGYGGLLLGRGSLHHQYKPVEWGHAHAHAQHHAPHLDPAACSPYSYPAVPGLEAPVQDTSKDLYWF